MTCSFCCYQRRVTIFVTSFSVSFANGSFYAGWHGFSSWPFSDQLRKLIYFVFFFLPYYGLFWLAGLTCHRLRPFTVASCSRDSTVRVWSLSQLASPLQIDVLANKPLDEIMTPNTGNEHTNQFALKKDFFFWLFSILDFLDTPRSCSRKIFSLSSKFIHLMIGWL